MKACLALLLWGWLALPSLAQSQPQAQPKAVGHEQPITLRQAVTRALDSHLQTQLSKERIRESEARLEESWAALNPQVSFSMGQSNRSLNLAAQGLSTGSGPIPAFISPFYSFDSRLQLVYNLLDASKRWHVKGAEVGRKLAEDQQVLARRTVGVLTSLAYVQLVSARHARGAGLADVALSDKLVALAKHQKDQGVAAGIDVTRAETQRIEQLLRQRRLDERVQRTNLELARLTGSPLSTVFAPAEDALPQLEQGLTPERASQQGHEYRIELSLARLREEQLQTEISAAQASNSPRLGVVADYGLTGNTPSTNIYGTHNVGLSLQIPLYDGGLSATREATLQSQLEQARLQRQDEEIQVEQEVRSAFLKLELGKQQILSARAGIALAEHEVAMTLDRFAAGLTNSLEVVTAQATLTRARDAEVQAMVTYQLAQIELAASMGRPEVILEGGIQ